MRKVQNGITLIALVITIIVLLILAGISIQTLTSSGLFQKTKEARDKSAEAEENESRTLNEYEKELGSYLSNSNNNDNNNDNNKGEKLADKVKVGDYVAYKPDTVSNTDPKYTTLISNLGTYSGSDGNTTSTLTQENLNWRVLDIQNGQVRLISEVPTTSTIKLFGYNGYNNAVKLLDDTCNVLYNNSKLSSKVQNIKIEDITAYMTTQPTLDTATYSPTDRYYPEILLKEKGQTVNGTMGTELDVSEQTEFINQAIGTEANSWEIKQTSWDKTFDNRHFTDSKYYELFINNGSNFTAYYMSSRSVIANRYYITFNVRVLNGDLLNDQLTWTSQQGEDTCDYAFRPVITLNSDVKITSGEGTSTSAYEIGL